jgi:hypothetical protein
MNSSEIDTGCCHALCESHMLALLAVACTVCDVAMFAVALAATPAALAAADALAIV